ncbi:hypothetical protein, partial [Mesorhizobium sp.]|uniref:hypothetical protein n=1 Tax=Mesorhizobium sp. TaxID=1871066 RepID=UPI0025BF7558
DKMKDKASTATVTKDAPARKIKGLWQVSQLAGLLWELGYLEESVEWEAACEEDGSQVPAMLGAAMRQIGDVLI